MDKPQNLWSLGLDFELQIDYELRTWFIETVHFPTAIGAFPPEERQAQRQLPETRTFSHL